MQGKTRNCTRSMEHGAQSSTRVLSPNLSRTRSLQSEHVHRRSSRSRDSIRSANHSQLSLAVCCRPFRCYLVVISCEATTRKADQVAAVEEEKAAGSCELWGFAAAAGLAEYKTEELAENASHIRAEFLQCRHALLQSPPVTSTA